MNSVEAFIIQADYAKSYTLLNVPAAHRCPELLHVKRINGRCAALYGRFFLDIAAGGCGTFTYSGCIFQRGGGYMARSV